MPFPKKEFILLELQMKKAVQGFADLNSLATEHHAGKTLSPETYGWLTELVIFLSLYKSCFIITPVNRVSQRKKRAVFIKRAIFER